MKNRNLLVISGALVLIAVVVILAAVIPQTRTLPDEAPSLSATQEPAPAPSEELAPSAQTADAYLVVTVGGMIYEPLPLSGEGAFTIQQAENTTNTIHVTPDSIWMEHSTCENQDCVDQGTVSLENMNSRVLGNMIICLPNEIVLELHTPETLESTFGLTP